MWKITIIIGFLVILSIYDIKNRSVSVLWMTAGSFFACGYVWYMVYLEQYKIWECAAGLIPGVLFLLFAWITKKIGYGDGWLLLILGFVLGYRQCITALMISLLLTSFAAIILLILHRAERNTKLPFIPFLTAAIWIGEII